MTTPADSARDVQGIAVPAYFYPGTDWDRLRALGGMARIAVANPHSGPGADRNHDYVAQIADARAAAIHTLGYVHTQYGNRPLAAVITEINRYYDWYGVDGIFLDEASNSAEQLPYYRHLHMQIKYRGPGGLVVLNPGTSTDERYLAIADIVVTFEGSARTYLTAYAASNWQNNYDPRRIWHLVHGVSSQRAMRRVIALSKRRGAGWVYVTPDTLPNPWGALPLEDYWRGEIAAIQRCARRAFW